MPDNLESVDLCWSRSILNNGMAEISSNSIAKFTNLKHLGLTVEKLGNINNLLKTIIQLNVEDLELFGNNIISEFLTNLTLMTNDFKMKKLTFGTFTSNIYGKVSNIAALGKFSKLEVLDFGHEKIPNLGEVLLNLPKDKLCHLKSIRYESIILKQIEGQWVELGEL